MAETKGEIRRAVDPTSGRRVREAASGDQPLSVEPPTASKTLGEIKAYSLNTNTYQVHIQGTGGSPDFPPDETLTGVPRKTQNVGDISPLPDGTTVVVDFSLGFPYIDGVLNGLESTIGNVEDGPKKPSLGTNMPVSVESTLGGGRDDDYNRTDDTPNDAIPGDFVHMSPEGNYLGILRSKLNVLYGSEKAQIVTMGLHDLVSIICEDYEHYSSFGDLKIVNEDGRSSLTFRGASDQLNESGGKEDQWTFRLDIGDKGNLFNMRVTDGDDKTLSQIHLTPEGKITLIGVNGVDIVSAGKGLKYNEIGGSEQTRIQGDSKTFVDGNITVATKGSRTTTVSESDRRIIGNDDSVSINRNQNTSIGGNLYTTVTGGDVAFANPTNVAVDYQVLNGSYKIGIGDPSTSSTAALAGYSLFVYNGDIVFGEDPNPLGIPAIQSTIALNTSYPDSIGLGGTPSLNAFGPTPGMQHAVLFESLNTLLTSLISWLDTHTHPTAWGPSGVPTTPSSSSLSSLIEPCMSLIVQIAP